MTALEGFAYCTRKKIIFNIKPATRKDGKRSPSGGMSVEDLWDLNADVLEVAYKDLAEAYQDLAGTSGDSIRKKTIKKPTEQMKELQAKMAVLEYIVGVKDTEDLAKISAAEKRKKKAVLLAAMEQKQSEILKTKSLAELQAEIDALEDE